MQQIVSYYIHLQVAYAVEDLRSAIPEDLPAGLNLLKACWEDEAAARPTFSMIVSHMADTLAALSDR